MEKGYDSSVTAVMAYFYKNCAIVRLEGEGEPERALFLFALQDERRNINMENMKVPNHIAIILDGNGRWAKSKGMPRNYGHVQGSKNVETVCAAAYDLGVKYLTVYAFSTENWNRPKDEVDALMKLLHNYMKTCLKTAAKNNMRVRVLGDKMGLAPEIRKRIAELEEATKD